MIFHPIFGKENKKIIHKMINSLKNSIHRIIILLFALSVNEFALGQVQLFPDRSSCVSGDTIWFNAIIINNGPEQSGNVVHVQLDNTSGNHITQVSVLCENNLGQGYLPIPDSLSTGTYILKAFSLGKQENNIINQRILIVYNRFENKLESINVPVLENTKYFNAAPEILIETNKESFKTREQVEARIQLPAATKDNIKYMFIVAGLEDPFSRKYNSVYFPTQKSELSIPSSLEVEENNGILVTGKILNHDQPE